VHHPVAKSFDVFVQPGVALLLNHFRSVRDRFLHELHHVGFGLKRLAKDCRPRRSRPEVGSGNLRIRTKSSAAAWRRFRAKVRWSFWSL